MNATVGAPWRTAQYAAADQFDAWRQKLNAVYGSWNPNRPATRSFDAEVVLHAVGNLRIAHCQCDPCGAVRGRPASAHERETLAVQLVISGREHVTIDDQRRMLGAGDVLIWNTTRPMSFEVTERLDKLSLLMPLARLKDWLPHAWHSMETLAPNGSVAARLLSSFVTSMFAEFSTGALSNADALSEAAVGIIVGALGSGQRSSKPESLRDQQFARLARYIDSHLDDPELSPSTIAAANRISLRYLHWLFAATGTSVMQYVMRKRLRMCRREILNPVMAKRRITDIAYSWGFQNCTHFSRRFKSEFGISPQQMRLEAGL